MQEDKTLGCYEWLGYAWIAVVLAMCVVMLSGCSSLMTSTKDKQINFESTVYGFKVVMIDPSTGSISPTGEMGFGSLEYRSMPVEKGQPFYVKYTSRNLFSVSPTRETIIWIGRANDKGALTFECVPAGMIKLGADGIKTNSATLTVIPEGVK